MNIILDIIIVAIVVICVFLSAKRGFTRTIIELVGFVAAILIAINLSTPVANL